MVGRVLVPKDLVARIVALREEGRRPPEIARKLRLNANDVRAVLRERDRGERVLSGALLGRAPLSRIARSTQHPTMLAGHRGPDGHVMWDSVPGHYLWSEDLGYYDLGDIAHEAVAEAMRGLRATSPAVVGARPAPAPETLEPAAA